MTALLLILLVLLVFVNGFFVAAEFALVRSRRSQMEKLVEQGSRGAELALRAIDRIDEYLSAAQVGITMASIGLGFLGEPAIAKLVEPIFGGVLGHGFAVAISVTIAYTIVTSAHVIVGEQAPKMLAITRAGACAQVVARPLRVVSGRFPPGDLGPERLVQLRVKRILRIEVESDLEAADRRGAAVLIGRGALRGARPERGRHARGRVPPARAGGPPGDDADSRRWSR